MQKILVATDFSDYSEAAVKLALSVAQRYGASVTLFHVCSAPTPAYQGGGAYVASPEQVADVVAEAKRTLEARRLSLAAGEVAVEVHTAVGDPATEIVRYADDHGYELIVLGTHGRRGVRRLLLGSVAEMVVRTAQVPVLTARAVRIEPAATSPA